MLCVVFRQDSESGLGIEIGHRQPECQCTPKSSSRANPAVAELKVIFKWEQDHLVQTNDNQMAELHANLHEMARK